MSVVGFNNTSHEVTRQLREMSSGVDLNGRHIIESATYDDSLTLCNGELHDFSFSERVAPATFFDSVNFAGTRFVNCRFVGATLQGGNYRGCEFEWCDFRFAHLDGSMFEDATFRFCDFFAVSFGPTVDLRGAQLINTSLSNAVLDGALLAPASLLRQRKDNSKLRQGVVQESKGTFFRFHTGFAERRIDEVRRDPKYPDSYDIRRLVNDRANEAETVYRLLSGMWTTKGNFGDASWAYVRAKRSQRRRVRPLRHAGICFHYVFDPKRGEPDWCRGSVRFHGSVLDGRGAHEVDACNKHAFALQAGAANCRLGVRRRLLDGWRWLTYGFADGLCSFGTSVGRVAGWVAALVVASTFGYWALNQLKVKATDAKTVHTWHDSLLFALGSLTSNRPGTLVASGRMTDLLSALETVVGVLLVGLLGFIVANKFRQS